MDEYIKRGTVVEKITALVNESGKYTAYESGAEDACYIVEHEPPGDVVEVVRCRDCTYYNIDSWLCTNRRGLPFANPNKFCSMGVRRTPDVT